MVDPQSIVDWLVKVHTCEWCGDTIYQHDKTGHWVVQKPVWRCWEIKKNGYTSKHWKHWRICATCNSKDIGGFGKWIFPVIKGLMDFPEHEALSAIMAVQPMNVPDPAVFYMDIVHGPRGWTKDVLYLDDANFRAEPNPCGEVALTPTPSKITYQVMPLVKWEAKNLNDRVYTLKERVVKP